LVEATSNKFSLHIFVNKRWYDFAGFEA